MPPPLLDLFFTFNIAVSIIVLMVGLNTRQPLEFSAFPTVLLIATLLRLGEKACIDLTGKSVRIATQAKLGIHDSDDDSSEDE